MKKNLKIETKSKNYNIQISDEPIEKIWHEINLLSQDKKRLFVISKRVYKLYKDIFNNEDYPDRLSPQDITEKSRKCLDWIAPCLRRQNYEKI